MADLHFDLVSPEKLLFAGDVDQVDLPGSEGDLGVLTGHAPLVTTLRPGHAAGAGNSRIHLAAAPCNALPAVAGSLPPLGTRRCSPATAHIFHQNKRA
jgi:hypothetical protein